MTKQMKRFFLYLSLLFVADSSIEAFTTRPNLVSTRRINGAAAKRLQMSDVSVEQSTLAEDTNTAVENAELCYQIDQADPTSLLPVCNTPSTIQEWPRTVVTAVAALSTTVALWDTHIPQLLWHAYQHSLEGHPIYTKAATSATVYAVGDVVSQRTAVNNGVEINGNGFSLDVPRVLRSLVAGGLGHGPLSHFYYNLSEHLFGHILHWTAWWSTIPKIVVDQTLFGPIWNNSYLLLIGLMQGQSLQKIGHDMRTTTIPLIVSGLKLWPAVHVVTYGVIPVPYRLLWVDAVEILWVSILSTEAAAAASPKTSSMEGPVDISSPSSASTAIR